MSPKIHFLEILAKFLCIYVQYMLGHDGWKHLGPMRTLDSSKYVNYRKLRNEAYFGQWSKFVLLLNL